MEKKINPIDQIIKEKLEGIQVPFDAASWQLMEQKLDDEAMGFVSEGQPVADAKHVDEAVFEKLHRYKPAYEPNHWQRMEALLEEAFAWPRLILRYKLAEVALMFLLFLLLWQYVPAAKAPAIADTPRALEAAPYDDASDIMTIPDMGPGHNTPQAILPNHNTTPQAELLREPSSTSTSSNAAASPTNGGNGVTSIPLKEKTLVPGKAPAAQSTFVGGSDTDESGPPLLLPLSPVAQRLSLLDVPAYPLPEKKANFPLLLAELDWLETLPAELAYEGAMNIGDATFTKSKNRSALRVGMFGSAEYNLITVPSSQEKKLDEELQRYAMGYGGGLSLGIEFGRFEIETGAIYAARQYPVGLLYINGSVGSGLQGQRLEASELGIVNVPLHFRYNFLSRGSWRAYALAGASLQVAFQRNYFVTEERQFDLRPSIPPPGPAPMVDEGSAINRIRQSGLGWFEGGTFEENAYLTGNLGIGIERYINGRWSLFVQPTYQHSLQYFRVGLGANADQINSLSVLFGAKVRVK